MATKGYNVDEALEAILDDDFGLSDGDSSDEEEGKDYYACLGEPVVPPSDIEALTHNIVSEDKVDDDDGDDACCSNSFSPSSTVLMVLPMKRTPWDLQVPVVITIVLPGVICLSIVTIVTVFWELCG